MLNWIKPTRAEHSTLSLRLWEFTGTALVNLFIGLVVMTYLLPLVYMLVTSVKEKAQFLDPYAPLWPAQQTKLNYEGKDYWVYTVPTEAGPQTWALVVKSRKYAEFVDPAHPEQGLIHWEGNWRELKGVYTFHINWGNFQYLWEFAKFPMLAQNTLIIAFITEIGVLASSIAVAYGFSRFRIPGGKWLFLALVATMLIPESITLVPTYFMFVRVLGWNGTWLPLIVPHFFGSAVLIFLLRQNFRSIPRDCDESAMLDGAGPLQILFSIILPQSIPTVATVALLHFFYVWNELRLASLYLGIRPNLHTISFGIQSTQAILFTPELLQASALMVMVVPIVVLFLAQRYFMHDMVVTGLEK